MTFTLLHPFRLPRPGFWRKTGLAALGLIALMMSTTGVIAQTAETRDIEITFKALYNTIQRSIDITALSGCMSSGYKYQSNNIKFEIDENRALITGSGKFTYKAGFRIMTADCGGARQFNFSLPNVEKRRYTVIINGKYRGILDFTKSTGPVVLAVPPRNTANDFVEKSRLSASYAPVSLAKWKIRTAASVIDLFFPITKNHPESLEGRPEMALSIRRGSNANTLTVRITNTGYLDDSVSGEKFVAIVSRNTEGWYLDNLWRQNLCSRGTNAGKWVKTPCP